jgi:hypothetical protein
MDFVLWADGVGPAMQYTRPLNGIRHLKFNPRHFYNPFGMPTNKIDILSLESEISQKVKEQNLYAALFYQAPPDSSAGKRRSSRSVFSRRGNGNPTFMI